MERGGGVESDERTILRSNGQTNLFRNPLKTLQNIQFLRNKGQSMTEDMIDSDHWLRSTNIIIFPQVTLWS